VYLDDVRRRGLAAEGDLQRAHQVLLFKHSNIQTFKMVWSNSNGQNAIHIIYIYSLVCCVKVGGCDRYLVLLDELEPARHGCMEQYIYEQIYIYSIYEYEYRYEYSIRYLVLLDEFEPARHEGRMEQYTSYIYEHK
jgi:hypothetical protein